LALSVVNDVDGVTYFPYSPEVDEDIIYNHPYVSILAQALSPTQNAAVGLFAQVPCSLQALFRY
jgi:hypothetical protein